MDPGGIAAMLQSLHLKGVGPAPELSLEFAPRLNLLTGDNGLGKSFVLDIGWWALTGTWASRHAWPRESAIAPPTIRYQILGMEPSLEDEKLVSAVAESVYEFSEERWGLTQGRPYPPPSLILYARVDGSFSVWDSTRNEWGKPWGDDLPRRPFTEAYHFSSDALWEGLTEKGRVLSEGLIRDWVSWQRQATDSFRNLCEILKIISPDAQEELSPGEPVRISVEDVRDHPTLNMSYGKIPLVFASAGIKRVVGLAYLLVWAWQEHLEASRLLRRTPAKHVVFLLDEIEAHLHPKWQRLILPALLRVTDILQRDVNVQVLVTTHAPLVLASAEPIFDEDRDALFTFDLKGEGVEVLRKDWRNRGDACSWLTSDVFDLGEARSLPAEEAIQRAKEAMRQPGLSIEERRQIHHQLHDVLKDTDPFWTRWLPQAKAAGIEP